MCALDVKQFSYINPSYLLEVAEGDVAFLREVVCVFLHETLHDVFFLIMCARNGDVQKTLLFFHKLKTTMATIGVHETENKHLFFYEESSDAAVVEKVLQTENKIIEIFEKCCDELTTFIAEISGKI